MLVIDVLVIKSGRFISNEDKFPKINHFNKESKTERCYLRVSYFSFSPEQQYKVEVYQQQIDMEKLCHQGELLLKKVSDQTDRDMIQEPLTELRHLWDNLGDKINHRQVQRFSSI